MTRTISTLWISEATDGDGRDVTSREAKEEGQKVNDSGERKGPHYFSVIQISQYLSRMNV